MITPVFKLDQTDIFIILEISAKYSKSSSAEIVVSENLIVFTASPYYLRIRLSGRLREEDDLIKCIYDIDNGKYTIKIQKLTEGENFENLDMIVKMLEKSKSEKRNLIEPMSDEEMEEEENIETWEIEQKIENSEILENSSYGFANRESDIFQKISEEAIELFDQIDIAKIENKKRTELRIEFEENKFDEDHYLADFFEPDDGLVNAHSYIGFWTKDDICLSDSEKASLVSMKKKSLPQLQSEETVSVYSGLIQLLFGFCYSQRTFGEKLEPESSWTISRISSMLSWLDTPKTPRKSLESCFRRSLIYPLYRSWSLCQKCQNDIVKILSNGRPAITKILLEIRTLFNCRDPFYLLVQLYIDEYIIWMQSRALSENIEMLSKNISKITIRKKDVKLDLEELEMAAKLVMEENEIPDDDMTTMEEAMRHLGIELGADGEFKSVLEKDLKPDPEKVLIAES